MAKILISYGDERFEQSLKRIGKEAKDLGIFDKVILYSPKDLPVYIKSSPLMAYKKGGGYWVWKPYVIWNTLQNSIDGDVVVYVDAGCHLQSSAEWEQWFNEIKTSNTILFKYRSDFEYPGWRDGFNCTSVAIKHWTKKNTLSYFDCLFSDTDWSECNKIWAGFIIAKGHNNQLISEWLSITLFNPRLIMDPYGNELDNQEDYFVAHRHDQSILTPLAYYLKSKNNKEVCILPENAESHKEIAGVVAARIRMGGSNKMALKKEIVRIVKTILGISLYRKLYPKNRI